MKGLRRASDRPKKLNNSVLVVGGMTAGAVGAGGHVVWTAGEAEIKNGLGGIEGEGHLQSGRSPFSQKHRPTRLAALSKQMLICVETYTMRLMCGLHVQ